MTQIRIRFWGARGSHPVPGPDAIRYGGNTPCVEIQAAGQTIILDAGTGIIGLGRDLLQRAAGQPVTATLFFSHMHHDHTQGFPFFGPAYVPTSRLSMFGPSIFERDLEETLSRTMLPPNFPIGLRELPSLKFISTCCETEMVLIDSKTGHATLHNRFREVVDADSAIIVTALRSYAHPDGVLIYRVEWQGRSVVYATDTEGYVNVDQRLANFARDADLLIHDTQYTKEHYLGRIPGVGSTQGWGHSTPQMACALAQAAGVKHLVMFHHEPRYTDAMIEAMEQTAQSLFPNTQAAYEGLTIDLTAPEAPDDAPEESDQLALEEA